MDVGDCTRSYCEDTGEHFPGHLVRAGREKELSHVKKFRVWRYIAEREALGHKQVRVR